MISLHFIERGLGGGVRRGLIIDINGQVKYLAWARPYLQENHALQEEVHGGIEMLTRWASEYNGTIKPLSRRAI